MLQKSDIPNKPFYRFLNVLGTVLLILIWAYLLLGWKSFPDKVPSHFNGAGAADAWSGKGSLLMVPIIFSIVYIFINLVKTNPNFWNTGVQVTRANKERVLSATLGMISTTQFVLAVLTAYLTYYSSKAQNLHWWMLPVFLAGIFVPIVYYMIRIYHTPKNERK